MFEDSQEFIPSKGIKFAYASVIVKLFLLLRDTTEDGNEPFFDPVTKKGFLRIRIKTIFRDRIKPKQETPASFNNITEDEEFQFSEDFLKHADPIKDSIGIFEKSRATFTSRNTNGIRFPDDFPRFLDTDGLIS